MHTHTHTHTREREQQTQERLKQERVEAKEMLELQVCNFEIVKLQRLRLTCLWIPPVARACKGAQGNRITPCGCARGRPESGGAGGEHRHVNIIVIVYIVIVIIVIISSSSTASSAQHTVC